MAVHIFTTTESNYNICIQHGIVAFAEPKDSRNKNNTYDGLLSRLAGIKENDYVLIYIIGKKELHGVWQAEGAPFYEETAIWPDRLYPFRCKIKCTEYNFTNPLRLNDINDLRNTGKIWTWALRRASGSNSMFAISNHEFNILMDEYMKLNPFSSNRRVIPEPYPFRNCNIADLIHIKNGYPEYEYSLMTLLSQTFARSGYTHLFGNYTDFLCYVPTNLGKEIDILLMFENPRKPGQIISYDIIEAKRAKFDREALTQLIDYESWFLQKKVSGDLNMVRTTAIARSFSAEVIDYVEKRSQFENKPIKLLTYNYTPEGGLTLSQIL